MPKSKRSKVVHLTKTKPRGQKRKSELLDSVHAACDEHKVIYVFSCENLRSDPLKRLRSELPECRFIYGKNKVIQLALGKTKEEAYLPGLEKLSEVLKGDVGLVFTNMKPSEFEERIASFKEVDFARAGSEAPKDILVNAGPIVGQPSSMYEPLRKLLLPVRLNKAVVELEEDHYVCRKGDILSPEQAQALKFFGHRLATFAINLDYRWRDGELTQLRERKVDTAAGNSDEEEDNEGEIYFEEGDDNEMVDLGDEDLEEVSKAKSKKKGGAAAKKTPAKGKASAKKKTPARKAKKGAAEMDSDDDF